MFFQLFNMEKGFNFHFCTKMPSIMGHWSEIPFSKAYWVHVSHNMYHYSDIKNMSKPLIDIPQSLDQVNFLPWSGKLIRFESEMNSPNSSISSFLLFSFAHLLSFWTLIESKSPNIHICSLLSSLILVDILTHKSYFLMMSHKDINIQNSYFNLIFSILHFYLYNEIKCLNILSWKLFFTPIHLFILWSIKDNTIVTGIDPLLHSFFIFAFKIFDLLIFL